MQFWTTFADQLWVAWSPVLVAAYVGVRLLAHGLRIQVERQHHRAAITMIVFHLIALAVSSGQQAYGYDDKIAAIVAGAFKVLASLTLVVTALFRILLPRVGLALPRILIDLITAIGTIVALIGVAGKAGFSVTGLITTSAVLTAVIGFSLQDTLGNVMGGLTVQLDKTIAIGDWISLGPGQPVGQVVEIRWRYTAIQTRTWDTIIIPNSQLTKTQVTIIGRRLGMPRQSRRQVDFFVDFRTPPTDVIQAVEAALRADPVPRMAREPAAHALFSGVRDSYAHYCVRYWIDDLAVDEPVDSAVRIRVWFALRRANIAMSIPASSVFVTQVTAEREERKAVAELDRREKALRSVDLFRGLPDEMRRALADQLVSMPFARGESITREGANDEGLYMIIQGEAIVRIGSGAEQRDVARLVPGQFFGEMSLMTGEARTASVVAATDMECYRVDKPAFEAVLLKTPAIADQIAEVLVTRRSALSAVRDERDEVRRKRMETEKQNLIGRIRGFFGLDRAS